MNIQQLNNSGQSIQTFLITAVVILLLTGGCWLCTEEVNQYRSWSHRRRTRPFGQSSTRSAYSIAVRIRLLVWLYCNGHWAWARTTKAWYYILANSRADPDHGFGSQLRDVIDELDRDMSAGEYVSAYMTYNWSAPFQTSSGWNKKKEETARERYHHESFFADIVLYYDDARCYLRYNDRTFTLIVIEAINFIALHVPPNETCAGQSGFVTISQIFQYPEHERNDLTRALKA